jgi:hypothetical protein
MSTLKTNTLTGTTSAGSINVTGEGGSTTTNLQQGLAKAWFIFDQVNSNVIDDSFNISSVTDRGTGSMYGNYTNSMSSIHYTVMAATSSVASGSMSNSNSNRGTISSADTTARLSINVFDVDGTVALQDENNQQALAHGDLA